jgi:hypothetical protein
MSIITVNDRDIGTITIDYKLIDTNSNLKNKKELAVKALAAIQLLFLTRTSENELEFNSMLDIITNAVNEIESLIIKDGNIDVINKSYYN